MSRLPCVTEEHAKSVLLALGVSLKKRSALKSFTAQLEATVETIWAIDCVAGHYHKVAGALRDLRQASTTNVSADRLSLGRPRSQERPPRNEGQL